MGGSPVRTKRWPAWPVHGPEEEAAVLAVLRGGEWGGFPMPNVVAKRFSEAFAREHDCKFSQCVANGTVSLEIALQALGVEPRSEVIVPAYTFEATAAAVLFAGCIPVFADVEQETYCLSVDAVAESITQRTQALIPVHLAMTMADMDRLGEIAERHGLAVLEDCAHAHGARWNGRGAGSLGDAGSFSFQSSKLMTAGEGGIVVTNHESVQDGLFALTNCGRQRPGRARDVPVVGHNYRMTDLQAAILEVQLGRLPAQHELRRHNAALLIERLGSIEGLGHLRIDSRVTRQAIYQFVFKFRPEVFGGLPRDVFVAALAAEGVPCDGLFYEAIHRSQLFARDAGRYPDWAASSRRDSCPVAERAAYEESVWLPHHLLLGTTEDVEQLAEAIEKVCRHAQDLIDADHPAIERAQQARTVRMESASQ